MATLPAIGAVGPGAAAEAVVNVAVTEHWLLFRGEAEATGREACLKEQVSAAVVRGKSALEAETASRTGKSLAVSFSLQRGERRSVGGIV